VRRSLATFRSRFAALTHDLVMIPVAWIGSYWLRFNMESLPDVYWRQSLLLLPIALMVQGASFWYFGLYRGVWRFASIPDLLRILKAVAAGVLVTAAVVFLFNRLEGVPRSVFLLDGILLLLLLGGPRLAYRWLKDRHLYSGDGKRALIVGAGRAGEMLVRDMLRDASSPYRPAALVDDNRRKVGKDIHGLPVVGTCDDITQVVSDFEIDLIVIALPSATTAQIRRVVEICEKAGRPFRTLPRLQDIVSGQASIKDLRDVSIEDLLGREPVQLDWTAIERGSHGRTILVTGGGGSIGSELCRQIARLEPARLIVFERSEYNLYSIERELQEAFPSLQLRAVLGDVCDTVAVDDAFRAHRPHSVFHAAAYKHVPMLEAQLRTAVANNVLGTHIVAAMAEKYGCESFVLISSDKAVNPANVMGATKRIAEIICQDLSQRSETRFITVRFGNVLGSSGSVVPLFQAQVARGGPVTVTHPEVMRYFMTIPEASQLILQASVIGKGGEIFVLDMGEPIKIAYLAEQLIRLSGKRLGEDVEIVYTGLRPGEKLFEELFHGSEQLGQTMHPKILLANCRQLEHRVVQDSLAALASACTRNDIAELESMVSLLVPEQADGAGARVGAVQGLR
jgi:FlaA1/EpsC-like NDP-sugar epimerase